MICQGCEDSPFSCQGTRYGAFTTRLLISLVFLYILFTEPWKEIPSVLGSWDF